jgi:uncharacterized protein YbaP (TraB family)
VRHISPVPGNEKKMVSKFIDTPGFKLPDSESSMESMDFERNEHMVDFAAAQLEKPGEHFLLVGTAHRVGERGVPALLRKRGFTIEEH